jgi:hypothetical protein
VFVKVATFNALPKITEPPVLLMTRVAVLFTDDNLPVSVCAFVPVKVAVPDEVAAVFNDQFPVREMILVALAAVHVPAPLTLPLTVRTLPVAIVRVPVMVIPAQV